MEVSSRARNALLTALGVLVALVVVAIASRGSIPAGEGGARAPTQALVDILFTLYLLMIASSALLLLYLLVLRRKIEAAGGSAGRRRRPLESLLMIVVAFGIASVVARRLSGQNPIRPPELEEAIGHGGTLPATTSAESAATAPAFSWATASVTAALIVLAVAAWWYAGRARKSARCARSPLTPDWNAFWPRTGCRDGLPKRRSSTSLGC